MKYRQRERYKLLIKLIDDMGYETGREGICFGLDFMLTQALLTHQLDVFEERIRYIDQNWEELWDIFCDDELSVADKRKIEDNLVRVPGQKQDVSLTDIKAFFDGVALVLNPDSFSEVLAKSTLFQENNESVITIVESTELKKKGGLYSIGKTIGVYKPDALLDKMDSLKEAIQKTGSEDIVLSIGSREHIITVQYKPSEDKWIFMNANDLFIDGQITETVSSEQIGTKIWTALDRSELISIQIKTTQENYSELVRQNKIDVFDAFKQQHVAEMYTGENLDRLFIEALGHGHPDTAIIFETMIQAGKKFDYIGEYILYAIALNDGAFINRLLDNGAKLAPIRIDKLVDILEFVDDELLIDLMDKGILDQYKATELNDVFSILFSAKKTSALSKMIELVKDPCALQCIVTLPTGETTSFTALTIAIAQKQPDVARSLLKRSLSIEYINKADCSGYTALMYAVQNKDIELVQALVDRGADIHLTNPQGQSAMDMAKQLNASDIVALLDIGKNQATGDTFISLKGRFNQQREDDNLDAPESPKCK
ncbi:ankyrin repeat domain-containing protein [Legionella waltersii]|nr:ankyrin repeat domain-containing protein [Legionella waltersii]